MIQFRRCPGLPRFAGDWLERDKLTENVCVEKMVVEGDWTIVVIDSWVILVEGLSMTVFVWVFVVVTEGDS